MKNPSAGKQPFVQRNLSHFFIFQRLFGGKHSGTGFGKTDFKPVHWRSHPVINRFLRKSSRWRARARSRLGERTKQSLFLTALLVRDYDEAIAFYVDKLGFEVRMNTQLSANKRWVVLAPDGGGQGCILLAKPEAAEQIDRIGSQTGGRVFLFLDTDDFQRDFETYTERGVSFVEPPRTQNYGTVAVFEDLYGNRWDLIQHRGFSDWSRSPDERSPTKAAHPGAHR